MENASSFSFPARAKVVAIKRDRADREAKHDGVDLILRTFATGPTQNIGNVADYALTSITRNLHRLYDILRAAR